MALKLECRDVDNRAAIDFSGLLPGMLRELAIKEIEERQIRQGNRSVRLGDLFFVSGDPSDEIIELHGRPASPEAKNTEVSLLGSIKHLGRQMQSGRIIVHANGGRVGDHLGSQMSGGEIVVHGSAGDWVGAEMSGGLLRIHGDAGDSAGAAYRASPRGMKGGTLLIDGSAGNNVGTAMRRGLIAIGGNVGDLAGRRMLAGTILACGEAGKRPGAGMKRGTIAFLNRNGKPQLLPSFQQGYCERPPALGLVMRELLRLDFPLPPGALDQRFDLIHGDMLEGGRGEIFLATK